MAFTRIRDLREDNDKKQAAIADILGISQPTYSDYESGNINIPIDMLCKLADYYSTSVDYLIGRTDVKKSYPKPTR